MKTILRLIRLLLILPMVVLEIIALGLGWLLFWIHKPAARWWVDLYMGVLPDGKWYYDEEFDSHATLSAYEDHPRHAALPRHTRHRQHAPDS